MKNLKKRAWLKLLSLVAVQGSLISGGWGLGSLPMATAQEKEAAAAPAADEARAEYEKAFSDWKQILKDLREVKQKYDVASKDADYGVFQKQWSELISKGNKQLATLRDAAAKAYAAAPNTDPEITRTLVKMATDAVSSDDYVVASQLSKLLIENNSGESSMLDVAGTAAYGQDDFDTAEKYFKEADAVSKLSTIGQDLYQSIPAAKELWVKEQEIRKAEAAKDDLPRVKLTTSKGDIVLELYENEAPDTVGNFINLVEKGFYNGLTFHRVLPGFMAQGGDPKGDGTSGPGYKIFCECNKPDYRHHFAGSISMAHAGKDTGGSQFFLTFKATPFLDGKHTCFGRVVEGLDVLAHLQKRDPEKENPPQPDKIIGAEVIRKRDHAYTPKKVD